MPIRATLPDDFDRLQKLYAQLFQHELDNFDPTMNIDFPFEVEGKGFLRDVAGNINGRAGIAYTNDDDFILGFATLRTVPDVEYAHRKNIKPVQLQTLIVDKNHQGQGIGKSLIDEAIKLAKDNGFTHLRVSAMAKNIAARDLYKKCGLQEFEIHHEMEL